MEVIVIDQFTCEEMENSIIEEKLSKFEEIRKEYECRKKSITEVRNQADLFFNECKDYIDKSGEFFKSILEYFHRISKDWENFLLNSFSTKLDFIYIGYNDRNLHLVENELKSFHEKFSSLSNSLLINIETKQDEILEMRIASETAFSSLADHKQSNFASVCYWLLLTKYQFSIETECSILNSLPNYSQSIESQINLLESFKHTTLVILISSISCYFSLSPEIPPYQPFSLSTLIPHSIDPPSVCCKKFLTYHNTLFLRSGELQQWSGYTSYLTTDKFLHLCKQPSIIPIISINLSSSSHSFSSSDQEFYMTITTPTQVYSLRLPNFESFRKWRDLFKLYI